MPRRHLIVVPHTHWDREWHLTFEGFRQRLVPLLDGLLDLLEDDPAFRHFTLDGQSIVVDDYLEVRPEAAPRLERLIRAGRLLVGPWMVLPDEWLVSGEALIRNLQLGLRRARELGGGMPVGYVPDQFGHVGQLPQIFRGFGFESAVLWRGVGGGIDRTLFDWEAPDGSRVMTVYLPFGYGNAAQLPTEPEALADRLGQAIEAIDAFSEVPTLLMMNGSDHLPPQPALPRALEAAMGHLAETSFEIGTLPGFIARVQGERPEKLSLHRGELRSGLRAPLLPGCASARMAQTRRDFRIDSLLTRRLEPLAAWLGLLGVAPDVGSLRHAWRRVIESHPHDSICGCSTDEVHDEVETRLRGAETAVRCQLERVAVDFAARVRAPKAGSPDAETLLVWNPNAPGVAVVDEIVEADLAIRRGVPAPFHLVTGEGRRVPAHAELVEPGEVLIDWQLPAAVVSSLLPGFGADVAGGPVRRASVHRRGRSLDVRFQVASTPSGFDPDPVHRRVREAIRSGAVDQVRLRAHRLPRLRLRFADDLPGWGVRVYRLASGAVGGTTPLEGETTSDGGVVIANASLRIQVAPDGRIDLEDRASDRRVADFLRIVSAGDRGDEYNFDGVPDDRIVDRPDRVRLRLQPADEAEVSVEIQARYRVPRGLSRDRSRRSRATVALPVSLRLRLSRHTEDIQVEVDLDNTACDHRLRLHVAAPFAARRLRVESAFEVAERPIAPGPDAFGPEGGSEQPSGAVPQRSFAVLDDGESALSVANRAGGEVEAVVEGPERGALALTLLRAVGWLSRDDLVSRTGHAGPPLATPGAQVPGRHRLEFRLALHASQAPGLSTAAHRFAHPPLVVCGGPAASGPLLDGARLVEVDDPELPISAVEPRADGSCVVRLYNPTSETRSLQLGLPPGCRRLEVVDLLDVVEQEIDLGERPASATLKIPAGRILNLRLHPEA